MGDYLTDLFTDLYENKDGALPDGGSSPPSTPPPPAIVQGPEQAQTQAQTRTSDRAPATEPAPAHHELLALDNNNQSDSPLPSVPAASAVTDVTTSDSAGFSELVPDHDYIPPSRPLAAQRPRFGRALTAAQKLESEMDGVLGTVGVPDSPTKPLHLPPLPPKDARITVDFGDIAMGAPRADKPRLADATQPTVRGYNTTAFPALDGAVTDCKAAEELVLDSTRDPPVVVHANRMRFLFPHQIEGVQFLWRRFSNNGGGLLADEMGLGKTVQVAVFIASIFNCGTAANSRRDPNGVAGRDPVLIVGPGSVLDNWKKDLAIWVGHLNIKKFSGGHAPSLLRELKDTPRHLGRCHTDIVLTTYEGVVNHIDAFFSQIPWSLLVFDEAHLLKNTATHRYQAFQRLKQPKRFGLSGTPLQNSLKEYHTLFAILLQRHSWPDWNEFKEEFVSFIKAGRERDASIEIRDLALEKRSKLLLLTKKFMKRSTKDILTLPPKEDLICLRDMTETQSDLYFRVHSSYDQEMVLLALSNAPCQQCRGRGTKEPFWKCCRIYPRSTDQLRRAPHWRGMAAHRTEMENDYTPCSKCPYCLIFPLVWSYIRISNHPLLLFPADDDDEETEKKKTFVTEYLYGKHCEDRGKQLSMVQEMAKMDYSCKLDVLSHLLQHCHKTNHKCLIFSSFTKILDVIEAAIVAKYRYRRLDGKVPTDQRQVIIDQFNDDPSIFVFLMTVKAGGVGINVASADTVFIFDPAWNPIYDLQAQDRAHRMTQTKKVRIYRLFGSNTIEEYMYKKQLTKQQLSAEVVDEGSVARYFNTDEVNGAKNLFAFDGRQHQRKTGTQIAMIRTQAEDEELAKVSDSSGPEPSRGVVAQESRQKATFRRSAPPSRATTKRRRISVSDSSDEDSYAGQHVATQVAVRDGGTKVEDREDDCGTVAKGEIESNEEQQESGGLDTFTQKMADVFEEVGDGANANPMAHFTTVAGKTSVFNMPDVNTQPGRRKIPVTRNDVSRAMRVDIGSDEIVQRTETADHERKPAKEVEKQRRETLVKAKKRVLPAFFN